MPRLRKITITAMAALFAPALFALDVSTATQNAQPPNSAVPGTLNYVEGSASMNGQTVGQNAVGSATLEPGQVISTTNGRVEVLLTPGVFLRLAHNSAVQMVSPDLTDTVVKVEHGRATVEVDQLFKENDIHIVEENVPVQLVKTGLYEFDADRGAVLVFSGEAAVQRTNGKWETIKDHHDVNIAEGATMKPAKFDVDQQEQSGLYRWSSLRSNYLAESNQQMAGYYGAGYAPGWYWDPYLYDYTFLGAYPFISPFGWGFYPFGWGGYYGGGFYGRGFYGHGYINPRAGGFGPSLRGGEAFHGGGGFGGGFHGGGGFGGGGGAHGGR
jgi:uncharacterized membrane protein YgcG